MKPEEVVQQDVMSSFKYVCITILEVGNFLNTTTRNKNAVGYKMDSLLKTSDTKSPHRKGVTLLTYVAIHCRKVKPEAITLERDMRPVSEAFRYPYDMLVGDIDKIVKEIESMKKFVKEGEKCKEENPDDRWAEQCVIFIGKMNDKVLALKKKVEVLQTRTESLCVLFCEKIDPKAGDNLFKQIDQFVTSFDNGVTWLAEEDEKVAKEKEKAAKVRAHCLDACSIVLDQFWTHACNRVHADAVVSASAALLLPRMLMCHCQCRGCRHSRKKS